MHTLTLFLTCNCQQLSRIVLSRILMEMVARVTAQTRARPRNRHVQLATMELDGGSTTTSASATCPVLTFCSAWRWLHQSRASQHLIPFLPIPLRQCTSKGCHIFLVLRDGTRRRGKGRTRYSEIPSQPSTLFHHAQIHCVH